MIDCKNDNIPSWNKHNNNYDNFDNNKNNNNKRYPAKEIINLLTKAFEVSKRERDQEREGDRERMSVSTRE